MYFTCFVCVFFPKIMYCYCDIRFDEYVRETERVGKEKKRKREGMICEKSGRWLGGRYSRKLLYI